MDYPKQYCSLCGAELVLLLNEYAPCLCKNKTVSTLNHEVFLKDSAGYNIVFSWDNHLMRIGDYSFDVDGIRAFYDFCNGPADKDDQKVILGVKIIYHCSSGDLYIGMYHFNDVREKIKITDFFNHIMCEIEGG